MSKTFHFLSIDDFISEGEDISGNVRDLSKVMDQLIQVSPTDYDKKTNDFIETKLPRIWENIFSSFHSSCVKTKEITAFTEKYCQLCVHTNVIPSLTMMITSAFDNSFTQGKFYQINADLKEEDIAHLLDNSFDENSTSNENITILLPPSERPTANSIITPLITQIIQCKMFLKAKELYDSKKLTIGQISVIDQIFACIESSISKELVSAILPMLIQITIDIIDKEDINQNNKSANNDPIIKKSLPQICKFLSTFVKMIPQNETIDAILKVLCELSNEKNPVKTRLIAISEIVQVYDSVGIGSSAGIVKNAMINALLTSNQTSMIKAICGFLPKLEKDVEFTDEDLHNLLLRARNGDEEIISALVEIVNSVQRNIDDCANELTNYDILSPALYCSVIGKTTDEQVSRLLFQHLLEQTDKLMAKKGAIAHVVLNDRIKQHMNEEGVDLIKLLTFLFLCAPNVDAICNFIIRVFNLPQLPDDLIPMLTNFSRKLNDFESVPSVLALFNVLIERLKNQEERDRENANGQSVEDRSSQYFTNSLVQVVTKWIKNSNNINPETPEILKQLSELDFSLINDNVPCLVNEVISKSDTNSRIEFLFKVLNDSVPEKHAHWLIYCIFDLIHESEADVKKVFDIIIDHLQSVKNSETFDLKRYINGIYLLFHAVTYEADFFRIGEQNFGYTQKVILHLPKDNTTEMNISFHPFHSTRRIFAEVAHDLGIEIFQLLLKINDEEQEDIDEQDTTLLKYYAPLQSISKIGFISEEESSNLNESNNNGNDSVLYKEVPLELRIKIKKLDEYQLQNYKIDNSTPFLNLLAPKISILFDLIEFNDNFKESRESLFSPYQFESEYLFQIIKLFPQLNIVPKNVIQEVIVEKISLEDAMMFKDSPRIFPYAVACSTNNYIIDKQRQQSQQINEEAENIEESESDILMKNQIKNFVIELASHKYDIVSLSIACSSLLYAKFKVQFYEKELKKCLIDCSSSQIRTITSKFVSPELTDKECFVKLIEFTLLKENRPNTKQFYEYISRLNLDKEIFVPFYQKIDQYEYSFYSDPDETFISLLSLIPQSQEMIDLTIKRLFSPPTCRSESVPFVHTIESWTAALKFIQTELSIPKLHSLISHLALPQDLNQVKLSSDYTFKGRIGIINMGSTCYMNSLLQVLNTFQKFAFNLISKDTKVSKRMTPFMLELRNCMAKLRYLRGTTLSLNQFSIVLDKKFDPTSQQDIEEFFNILINRISEELKEEDDVADQIKIQISNNVSIDNMIVTSKKETIFNLSLPIENLTNLSDAFDAYFEDENIEYDYNGEKRPASLWKSIEKWPNYLVIQLQRWSYKLVTLFQEGSQTMLHKLVHEFDFPVILKGDDIKIHHEAQKCDSDYALSGVIIHQGTAEQGHYFAIVLGDDNEWYLCNDKKIEYFDISDLGTFSYGQQISPDDSQTPDEISTGYLLFYKKVDLKIVENNPKNTNICVLPNDLEELIDTENAKNWPSTVFYSDRFVDYVQIMIYENSTNPQMLDIAFTVLFKIAICDEKILLQWTQFMMKTILNKTESLIFEKFFDYIENEIGTSLVHLFAISENRTNDLSTLINFALKKVPNSTKPICSILKCVPEGQFLKRMFCSFLFDTISNCYQYLKDVDWSKEDEALKMMLNILSIQLSKEVQRQISKQHILAMNNVLGLFIDLFHAKGCNDTVLSVFDIARMNKINYIYKKCENFNTLMLTVNSIQNDFFNETNDATPATLELLSQILPQQNINENDSNEQLILDLNFLFPSIEKLIFCNDQIVRNRVCDYLLEMVGKKNIQIENYLYDSLIKNQFTLDLKEENTVALFVIGQFPKMKEFIQSSSNSNKENNNQIIFFSNDDEERKYFDQLYFNESLLIDFMKVILRICYIAPNVFQNEFRNVVEMFLESKHLILKRYLLEVVHHIIAYDKSILVNNNYDNLFDQILNTNVTSIFAIQILFALQDKVNDSSLFGACIEHYLFNGYDENAEVLIEMLKKGLKPPEVEIPKEAKDFISLKIVNQLWDVWPSRNRDLSDFMLSAFDFAKPYPLFQNSVTLSKTIELLKGFCEDELNAKIKEVSGIM